MMATNNSPESLEHLSATRKRMAAVRGNQQSTMLTALVFSLIVAGVTSLALMATWLSHHSHELGLMDRSASAETSKH